MSNDFTNQEVQKAVATILDSKVASKHVLPIKFETRGKTVVPVILKLNNLGKDGKPADEKDFKKSITKHEVSLGSEEDGLKIKMKTIKKSFTDPSGSEQTIELPFLDDSDPKNLFEAAHTAGKIFLALRNMALLVASTNTDMVNSSSVKPATGIVLADMIASDGRMQQNIIKEILTNTDTGANRGINQALENHASKKAAAKVREVLSYTTLVDFVEACKSLADNYDKIVTKNVPFHVGTSKAEPVVAFRTEASLERVKRVDAPTAKTLKNLL